MIEGKKMRWDSVDSVVEEMMRIHRSLPSRPQIDEVEAAKLVIDNADNEAHGKLERIAKQIKGVDVPLELFHCLTDMQKNLVHFTAREEKREALQVLDLDNVHSHQDYSIQRATSYLYSDPHASSSSQNPPTEHHAPPTKLLVSMDDSYIADAGRAKSTFQSTITLQRYNSSSNTEDPEKLSLVKLASLIESSAKNSADKLSLSNKLQDQIEWLPDSIGKLSTLKSLDLSNNRLLALPSTIGNLSTLTNLNLRSNQISQLPDTFGDLSNLMTLDISSNSLSLLPSSFSKLINLETLDLSSNNLSSLPESVTPLFNLKQLIIETNDIEEIPHTIGQCTSLVEFRAEYNKIRALPEAIGMLTSLEILIVRFNKIRQLPTTVSSLTKLVELDVSFNELQSIPESLCSLKSLTKINVGNNFAEFQFLPKSIGNLENLEELDISNNQIRILPDSLLNLSKLRVLLVDGNPLQTPPIYVAQNGLQAIVEYMEGGQKRWVEPVKVKKSVSCMGLCFFPKRRKSEPFD